MIPARALVVLYGCLVALGLVVSFWRQALPAWIAAGGSLTLATGIDAAIAMRRRAPVMMRHLPPSFPVASWSPVRLAITWEGPGRLVAEIFDHHPRDAESDGLPLRVDMRFGTTAELTYRLRPTVRGQAAFDRTEILIRSPWRLWRRRRFASAPGSARVLPDFRPLTRYALLAVDNHTSQLGLRLLPRRGEGIEVHDLREYRVGDALRQIDWKATVRRMALISRDYQDERNQQIVFLLDCGRTMRAVDRGEPHFDHALRSVLLLSYVALRQGDSVGLMTFGGSRRWLAPVSGRGAMKVLLDAVHDLDTSTEAPDYLGAAARFLSCQRRRSLAVIISNLRDDDGSELAAAMGLIRQRHLVLLASLRETVLDDELAGPIRSFDEALRRAAAHHYLAARRRAHSALSGRALRYCDVAPRDLPVMLVNRYLEIKRTGAL